MVVGWLLFEIMGYLMPSHYCKLDTVPFRIRIGVTGHRTLSNTGLLTEAVEDILATRYLEAFIPDSRRALQDMKAVPVFSVISPLAEGADRLVADIVLKLNGQLEALLPMPREEYEKDFSAIASRKEFAYLLDRAYRVEVTGCNAVIGEAGNRQKAYRRAGEEVVNRCNILVALWDEKKPKSQCGTGAIVALALEKKKPVFIVSTVRPGSIELKNGASLSVSSLTN